MRKISPSGETQPAEPGSDKTRVTLRPRRSYLYNRPPRILTDANPVHARTEMPRSKAQVSKALSALDPPDALLPKQIIARVDKALGHAQYACLLPSKTVVTADLDERFRQTVWVERGNYVLLERYDPKEVDGEAVAKIVKIAKDEKLWRKMSYWCVLFSGYHNIWGFSNAVLRGHAGRPSFPSSRTPNRTTKTRGWGRCHPATPKTTRRPLNVRKTCNTSLTLPLYYPASAALEHPASTSTWPCPSSPALVPQLSNWLVCWGTRSTPTPAPPRRCIR